MPYKASTQPLEEIARVLGVDAIVEGSVVPSGDRLRVTARLVDAAAGRNLWFERYDRASADVLAIQGEVASAIGGALAEQCHPAGAPAAVVKHPRPIRKPTTSTCAADSMPAAKARTPSRRPSTFSNEPLRPIPDLPLHTRSSAEPTDSACSTSHPGDTGLQERAFVEIERALAIDPDLDTAHLARGLLLWQPM
jgi:hypothetical protein